MGRMAAWKSFLRATQNGSRICQSFIFIQPKITMKRLLLPLLLCLVCMGANAQLLVSELRCENLSNPLGIDKIQPTLSWQISSPRRNTYQSAYEIRVSSSVASLNKATIWNTGKVQSDQSVFVKYRGQPLESGKTYFWQVRVWDGQNKASDWSSAAHWQAGLLKASDWKAKWIQVGYKEDTINQASPLFRKEFKTGRKLQSATAYITALGLYEATINGKRIGDAYLTPGWTSYSKRLQYQQYDVTALVKEGNNALGVMLGSGWYRGFIGFGGQHNFYGKDLALLFQLELTYVDGTSEIVISDNSWKSSTGSILNADIYNGETIDARLDKAGWNKPGYSDADWSGVRLRGGEGPNLIATSNEPVKKHEMIKGIKLITTPRGELVIDFGQNLVGWVEVKAKGNAGDKITLSHAEVLDKQGNFYIENLRPAKQQNIFFLKGGDIESFEPHFTFQGFRYIKVDGYPGDLKPENFTAMVLHSDMSPAGEFRCSQPLVNQLQHNIQWGQKGNFLDVPTDCPQRDERLGWTGDAQAFSRTATFNFNVHNFFSKWLKDVALDQVNGSVPFVVPNVLGPGASGSAGWADAATIIPWNMYLAYGDRQVLEDQYESMKNWIGYMESKSTNYLWNTGFHFGDWLFYRPFDDNDGRSAVTDKYLIAQCFFAHSTQLLVNAANVLGKKDDALRYSDLLAKVKEAFLKEYVTSNGRLISSTQTAYVLALNFDMLPESQRQQAAAKLVENIKSYNTHLTTGFLGTPYLCHVLSRFGYSNLAYQLLEQETYPSWLYPVKMGATTIWERWDGIKPDGTFQTPNMNSFNHYAYGAIGDWMYRVIAGIDTYDDAPGYKHIRIKPVIGGKMTYARADYQSNYGKVVSGWKVENGKLTMDVHIPANTKATIYVPAKVATDISEGGKSLTAVKEVVVTGSDDGYIVMNVGSGVYQFVVNNR
jgi:alpha-L-rhamnosidase